MIPAGYLASKNEMNLIFVILFGIFGSLAGALLNYILAIRYGRDFLVKFGKYLFMKDGTLEKIEVYFKKHGAISTFIGRLIPGIRQYISFPAGLAKMDLMKFSIYTSIGAGIWVTILTLLGYFIGENEILIKEYIRIITISILIILTIAGFIYYKINQKKSIKKIDE
jgi:membrane protein DedA with SNARE-associated domain